MEYDLRGNWYNGRLLHHTIYKMTLLFFCHVHYVFGKTNDVMCGGPFISMHRMIVLFGERGIMVEYATPA